MSTRTKGITIICVFAVLQSVLRFFFMGLALTGAELLEVEISSGLQLFINVMFFVIGIGGLLTVVGLWQMQPWGFGGTIIISVITIVFDIWALTIQATAAMGLILPVIFIVYLFWVRELYI